MAHDVVEEEKGYRPFKKIFATVDANAFVLRTKTEKYVENLCRLVLNEIKIIDNEIASL